MFGTTQLYVFVDHTKHKPGQLPDYEDAMEEIAKSAGFDTESEDKSPGSIRVSIRSYLLSNRMEPY